MTRLFLRQLKSIGFVDAGACEGADIIIAKRNEALPPVEAGVVTDVAPNDGAAAEALEALAKAGRKMSGRRLKQLQTIATQLTALLSDVNDGRDEEGNMPEKDNEKTAQPETPIEAPAPEAPAVEPAKEAAPAVDDVAKRLADIEKANATLKAELDDARKIAATERETRLNAEWITKAKSLKGLTAKADEFGLVLKRVADVIAKEDLDEIVRVLTAASSQVETSGLFAEAGVDGADAPVSAIEKINAIAADMVAKGEAKTHPIAFDRALRTNKELASAYLAESRKRN